MLKRFAERGKCWHGVLYGYSERGDLFGMAVTVLSLFHSFIGWVNMVRYNIVN